MADKFGWEKAARKDAARKGRPASSGRPVKAKPSKGHRKPGSTTFPFGKYKSHQLEAIPKEYLWWVLYNIQGLDVELVQDIIELVGNGLGYARQRGWAAKPLPPPEKKQPPRISEKEWGWGTGVPFDGPYVGEDDADSG